MVVEGDGTAKANHVYEQVRAAELYTLGELRKDTGEVFAGLVTHSPLVDYNEETDTFWKGGASWQYQDRDDILVSDGALNFAAENYDLLDERNVPVTATKAGAVTTIVVGGLTIAAAHETGTPAYYLGTVASVGPSLGAMMVDDEIARRGGLTPGEAKQKWETISDHMTVHDTEDERELRYVPTEEAQRHGGRPRPAYQMDITDMLNDVENEIVYCFGRS